MNTQTFNTIFNMKFKQIAILTSVLVFTFSSCKKDTIDDKVFQIENVSLYSSASSKLKEKTESQWIAVVYTKKSSNLDLKNFLFCKRRRD